MLLSIFLTGIIPLVLFSLLFLPEKNVNNSLFFNKKSTTALKGLAAIVVIFVHIPSQFCNPLQDAIGSFAYVAVTYFFLVSAYGMQLAAETKSGYMTSFWKNRAASLLIPMFLVNIVCFAADYLLSGTPEFAVLTVFSSYVLVLLTYCLWFWCLELTGSYFGLKRKTIDAVNISGVVISSLVLYFAYDSNIAWCFERMGLIWGLLLFRYFPSFTSWLGKDTKSKRLLFLALSLVLGVAYLKYKHVYFWGGYSLKIMLGITMLVCLALWSGLLNFNNRILLFLGGISYEIYLIHAFFMTLLRKHLTITVSSGMFIVITIVSVILIAYLVNRLGAPLVKIVRQTDIVRAVKKCFSPT